MTAVPHLCRDCLNSYEAPEPAEDDAARCPECGSPRLVHHRELHGLPIAHIDCDAFYAAVEKRDDPALADRPVIIGGGRRGVVAAACYVARLYGVRSAMPMFKALAACPEAVIIRPNMAKYREAGQAIRMLMREVTPLVQPLSIDEAFLDLRGAGRLYGNSPAATLARLVLRIEHDVGVTASIGLSYNKFLAKIASDLDKPRGFAVIGSGEAQSFLATKPVGILWGVGQAMQSRLHRDGITTVGQLQQRAERDLIARYGSIGSRLYHFARGEDHRSVDPSPATKSISAETTFDRDLSDGAELDKRLQPLCQRVADRLREKRLAGRSVTVKLKDSDFRLLTRSRRLRAATQRAETLYETAAALLAREADGRAFRLIGVGAGDLVAADVADPPELFGDTISGTLSSGPSAAARTA